MGWKRATPTQHYAPDRDAWTRWLEAHHDSATEVQLVFWRKATGTPCISYDAAVEEALRFGWIDGIKRKLDDERYTFRFTPRRPDSAWSESNIRGVAALEAAGRMHPAGAAAVAHARTSGAFAAAVRADQLPIELGDVLRQSPAARAAYDALPPSHRRSYHRWVGEAKKPETRARRAAQAIAHLLRATHPW
jgi:uncharacterized protein YdeI (YjbR/CyaY-like superfamily)